MLPSRPSGYDQCVVSVLISVTPDMSRTGDLLVMGCWPLIPSSSPTRDLCHQWLAALRRTIFWAPPEIFRFGLSLVPIMFYYRVKDSFISLHLPTSTAFHNSRDSAPFPFLQPRVQFSQSSWPRQSGICDTLWSCLTQRD